MSSSNSRSAEPTGGEPFTYYCWVRIVNVRNQTTETPAFRVEPTTGPSPRHWDLRARAIVDKPTFEPTSPLGVWSVVDGTFGRHGADAAFDYGPAYMNEADALKWPWETEAGRQWDAEGSNRFLVKLAHYPKGVSGYKPVDPPQKLPPQDFDKSHAVDFMGDTVVLPEPKHFYELKDECGFLMKLKSERTKSASAIYREAFNARYAVAAVFASIGLDVDDPVNHKLAPHINHLLKLIEKPILDLKQLFGRPRPWTTCSGLEPMLAPPDWRHPGHPAYPSGHATVAWTFAYLVGDIKSAFVPLLHSAAERVSLNREIAGVHYRSDSLAGKDLARELVTIIQRQGGNDYKAVVEVIKALTS
jgi:membrane-associated phospholipid phosphatase